MKPFDEEKAKAGVPVCTRDGRDVRIICYDAKGDQPIVALLDSGYSEHPEQYCTNGCYYPDPKTSSDNDLFMKPVKREGWVNLYNFGVTCGFFSTEKEARDKGVQEPGYVATARIEWEE